MDSDDILFGIITVFGLGLFVVGLFTLTYWSSSKKCYSKYKQYQPSYALWEGCQVTYKGERVPADTLRFGHLD